MAMSEFFQRHGVTVDRERIRDMHRRYVEGLPTKDMIVDGVEEMLEVSLVAGAVGALEQRYGEEKTTLFMKDQTDASGNPIKDADGNAQKKSGTGMPMSAGGAILGTLVAAFAPMSSNTRRRVLNATTGLAAAYAYRKGIDLGQQWLDSKQPAGTPKSETPVPPFAQSPAAVSEIANIKGELSPGGEVVSFADLVESSKREIERRRRSGT